MLSTHVEKRCCISASVALATTLMIGAVPTYAQNENAAPVVKSQQTELEALRSYVSDLTKRFEEANARSSELEKQQKEWSDSSKKAADTAAKTPAVTAKSPVIISGTLAVHGLNYLSQDGPAPEAPSTFRVRRGELRLTAPRITDRVSGTVMIDIGKSVFNRSTGFDENGSNTIRARENILQDLMLSYLLKKSKLLADGKAGSDNIFIDAGQFKIPVGYESTLLSSAQLPFVERALMFTQRDPFDGGYGDVRDTGIQLRGTRGKFDFRLGIFNGLGDRQNTLANSDAKAVLGMLAYRPNANLQIGISGGCGNTGIRNSGSLLEAPRVDRDLFNAFAVYKKGKWTLQGEYSKGSGVGLSPSQILVSRDIQGYYGTVGYMLTPKLEGLLRYDCLNADRDAAGDTSVRDLILGLNYYLKGNTKIQANLIRRDGARDLAGASSVTNPHSDIRNDRAELRTSFQVAF